MKILLSNDDGYDAPGLQTLAQALLKYGDISIVAPDRNRSGASHALTLETPVRVETIDAQHFRVHGTPADCVHLALTTLLTTPPDLVIAGINHGANLGDDVLYSGTVAAAAEARHLCRRPALAVSIAMAPDQTQPRYLETAASLIGCLITQLPTIAFHPDTCILNINIPDRPIADIAGWTTTRLGYRYPPDKAVMLTNPRGQQLYWVGLSGSACDAALDTDFAALERGYVSVTPLQLDVTHHQSLQAIQSSLQQMPVSR
jgi:5'-nucleotidase